MSDSRSWKPVITFLAIVAALYGTAFVAVTLTQNPRRLAASGPPLVSAADPALERRVAALEARLDELQGTLRRREEERTGPPLETARSLPPAADFDAAVAAAMEKREREIKRRDFVRNAETFLRSISHQVTLTDARREAVIPAIADWHEARDRALHGTPEDMAGRDAAFALADAALDAALRAILSAAEAEAIHGLLGANRPGRPPR